MFVISQSSAIDAVKTSRAKLKHITGNLWLKPKWRKYTFYFAGGFLIGAGFTLIVWRFIEFFKKDHKVIETVKEKTEALEQKVAQLAEENEDIKQAINDIVEDSVEKHETIRELTEGHVEMTQKIKLMADESVKQDISIQQLKQQTEQLAKSIEEMRKSG
jgi:uncharacterized protein YoxC